MWLVGKGNNRTKTNRTKGVSLRDKEHWLYLAVHPQDLHLLTHWTPVYGFWTKSCALRRMESETTIERSFRTIESCVIESDDINEWMRLPLTVQQLLAAVCKIKSVDERKRGALNERRCDENRRVEWMARAPLWMRWSLRSERDPKPIRCGVFGLITRTIEASCEDVSEAQNDTRWINGNLRNLAQRQANSNSVYWCLRSNWCAKWCSRT